MTEILKRYVPGETGRGCGEFRLRARIAQDAHGIPDLPRCIYSRWIFAAAYEFPAVAGMRLPRRMPKWGRRVAYRLIDMLMIDRHICPAINALRAAELGLGKISRLLNGWWNSPTRVLGLFPDWFAPPQPDWPAPEQCSPDSRYTMKPAPRRWMRHCGNSWHPATSP